MAGWGAVAQHEGAEAHLLDVVAIGVGLAFPVEDLVFGGAASANHGGFCKIKRKDGSSLNVAEEAGAHRMDAVPIGVGLSFPV